MKLGRDRFEMKNSRSCLPAVGETERWIMPSREIRKTRTRRVRVQVISTFAGGFRLSRMEFRNAASLGAIAPSDSWTNNSSPTGRTIPVVHYTRISINRLSNNTRETRVWIIYYVRVIPSWRSLLNRDQRSPPLLSAFAPFNCSELRARLPSNSLLI